MTVDNENVQLTRGHSLQCEWLYNKSLQQLFDLFETLGRDQLRLVGGVVRDGLMGLDVPDIDLATPLLPQKVMMLAEVADVKAIPTGIEHGTVTVIIEGQAFEITTLRRDIETDGRHAIVHFSENWLDDAKRRDFTINALYADREGRVYDPLGTGLEDLKNNHVRFIGDAGARIKEDYLRILRFFRMNASYGAARHELQSFNVGDRSDQQTGVHRFELDPEGEAACIALRAGLRQLSAERVGAELLKLLAAPYCGETIEALYRNGLLTQLLATPPKLPRLLKTISLEIKLALTPCPLRRLALLGLYHSGDGKRMQQRFRLSKAQTEVLLQHLPNFNKIDKVMSEEDLSQLCYRMGQKALLAAIFTAWVASEYTIEDQEWQTLYHRAGALSLPEFPVSGQDLLDLGAQPGPQLGDELKRLEALWLASNMTMNRQDILRSFRQD